MSLSIYDLKAITIYCERAEKDVTVEEKDLDITVETEYNTRGGPNSHYTVIYVTRCPACEGSH